MLLDEVREFADKSRAELILRYVKTSFMNL
jgi:hypothetical protein